MVAIKTHFDGQKIDVPPELRNTPPGEVIVIFAQADEPGEKAEWLKAQEKSFSKIWDNPEDEIYDRM
jgi:hypothetical protein